MSGKIFLVSNSHIDPVWLWSQYEGIDEALCTFKEACDRLDEYPEVKFTASSSYLYSWVKELSPATFGRIRKHVEGDRWEVAGGWVVEPDCNLPLGISFYKQAELGRAFFKKEFDREVEVAFCPDSFGHAASLPKILAETGFKYYIFCRPQIHENDNLPDDLFYWEYEGKRVLCFRPKYHYTSGKNIERFKETFDAMAKDDHFVERGISCYLWGNGDHGGGPTRKEIDYVLKRRQDIVNREFVFSTANEFFRAAERLLNIPTYRGDLFMHAVGCYSVNREIKIAMREAEFAVKRAEDCGVAPEELLDEWSKILFNQFHDILPGSCRKTAAKEAVRQLHAARSSADLKMYRKLKALTAKLRISHKEGSYIVFNTLPFPVRTAIEMESFVYDESNELRNGAGHLVPVQLIEPSVHCHVSDWLFLHSFSPLGHETFYFSESSEGSKASRVEERSSISNQLVKLELGSDNLPRTVDFVQVDNEILLQQMRLLVLNDTSDTWGHFVRSYDGVEGEFKGDGPSFAQTGPILNALSGRLKYNHSFAEVEYRLYDGLNFVEMRLKVKWNEYRKILKLEIPVNKYLERRIRTQIPAGSIRREADGMEMPLQNWLKYEGAWQFGLAQKGAFAFDSERSRLRVTLVRSSLYGYDHRSPADPSLLHDWTDQGEHEFALRFFAAEEICDEELTRQGEILYNPPFVIRECAAE